MFVAAIVDAWSRQLISWSIADHLRTELVVDALDMAIWWPRPEPGSGWFIMPITALNTRRERSGKGSGRRPVCSHRCEPSVTPSITPWPSRSSGPSCSSCWTARAGRPEPSSLAAIFEYIQAFYNPKRRHSSIGYHSPIDYKTRDTSSEAVANVTSRCRPGNRANSISHGEFSAVSLASSPTELGGIAPKATAFRVEPGLVVPPARMTSFTPSHSICRTAPMRRLTHGQSDPIGTLPLRIPTEEIPLCVEPTGHHWTAGIQRR